MVQHVLNIKRLNYQTLLCHRGSAPAADANPACHNHQPLLTKQGNELWEMNRRLFHFWPVVNEEAGNYFSLFVKSYFILLYVLVRII